MFRDRIMSDKNMEGKTSVNQPKPNPTDERQFKGSANCCICMSAWVPDHPLELEMVYDLVTV